MGFDDFVVNWLLVGCCMFTFLFVGMSLWYLWFREPIHYQKA